MRVALCFSGLVRTLMQTYPDIGKYLLEPFKPDVFIHTYDAMDARKQNDMPVSESWLKGVFNSAACRIVPKAELDMRFKRERDFMYMLPGPVGPGGDAREHIWKLGNVLSQLWHVYECDRLRQAHEQERGFRYDLVIRARFDLVFKTSPSPLSQHGLREFPPNTVFIPDHAGYGGLCDQFAMGDSDSMKAYSEYYVRFEEVFRSRLLLPNFFGAPENMLRRYLDRFTEVTPVHFRFPFEIMRADGVFLQSQITSDYFRRHVLKEAA